MYAIIDKRSSQELKENLKNYVDDIFEFSSENITSNSISGHPDIFVYQDVNRIIIAPNTPTGLINFLDERKIKYLRGTKPVGKSLDNSVLYNCVATDDYFFCKNGKPDVLIQKYRATQQIINLPQSYVRCSMFSICNKVVTSDLGIIKVLENSNIDYLYFNPSEITIKEHKNGFIGGTMGEMDNKIFFLGNILKHKDGEELYHYINKLGKEVVCLGSDYLYDGGGIFFVS